MYEIRTYKKGFLSWATEVTRTDHYRVPWMSIDQPKPKDYDQRPLQPIQMDLGTYYGMTSSISRLWAIRALKKDRSRRNFYANSKIEVFKGM